MEDDVKKAFIQLLETEQDADREYRVEEDTFCTMFNQIRSGERKLSISDRKKLVCKENPSN